jgi:hypothetical protein
MSIRLWAVGLALASLGFAGEAAACPRDRAIAGIVQRVSGQVGDTRIERAGAPTIRPAPMETLCEGDVVIASAATRCRPPGDVRRWSTTRWAC